LLHFLRTSLISSAAPSASRSPLQDCRTHCPAGICVSAVANGPVPIRGRVQSDHHNGGGAFCTRGYAATGKFSSSGTGSLRRGFASWRPRGARVPAPQPPVTAIIRTYAAPVFGG